jgi:hypothetical protein
VSELGLMVCCDASVTYQRSYLQKCGWWVGKRKRVQLIFISDGSGLTTAPHAQRHSKQSPGSNCMRWHAAHVA